MVFTCQGLVRRTLPLFWIVIFYLLLSANGSAHELVGARVEVGLLGDGARRLAVSDDGSRMLVGVPTNGNGVKINGYAAVYELQGGSWTQLGSTIEGEASEDRFGWTVAMSGNGQVIAVGAPSNDDGGDLAGHVRVYAWSGTEWAQRGADIDGVAVRARFGGAVSLDATGARLAVSDASNSSEFISAGSVRVFDWNGDTWIPVGEPVFGEARADTFGGEVVLSADGSRFAAASNVNDFGGQDAGYVRVFEWNGSMWLPLGDDIIGQNPGDREGASIDLDAGGNRLVTSATLNSDSGPFAGQVRVFDWNGTAWQQLGQDLEGDIPSEQSGSRVAISADGETVLLGSPRADTYCRQDGGWVRAYRLDGGVWASFGETLIGIESASFWGGDVDISADGSRSAFIAGEFTPGEGVRSSLLSHELNRDVPSQSDIVAVADAFSTPENLGLGVGAPGILDNDTTGVTGDLCVFEMTTTENGQLATGQDGSFDYTPEPAFCGVDTFSYRFSDGQALSNTADVALTVICETIQGMPFSDGFEQDL